MRKLVIGVVAVIVLHIGFNSYMARDRTHLAEERVRNAEAIKAIYPVNADGPAVVDVAALWPEPRQVEVMTPAVQSGPRTSTAQPTLASYRQPKRAAEPTPERRPSRSPRANRAVKPFDTGLVAVRKAPRIRTEYPRSSTTNTMANYSDSVKEKRQSDDPLFFTVFKKPAGWIKSVASKVF